MSKFLDCALLSAAILALAGAGVAAAPKKAEQAAHAAGAKRLGIGREAKPEEIAGWDIDIRPDGMGLPRQGTVKQGEAI